MRAWFYFPLYSLFPKLSLIFNIGEFFPHNTPYLVEYLPLAPSQNGYMHVIANILAITITTRLTWSWSRQSAWRRRWSARRSRRPGTPAQTRTRWWNSRTRYLQDSPVIFLKMFEFRIAVKLILIQCRRSIFSSNWSGSGNFEQ